MSKKGIHAGRVCYDIRRRSDIRNLVALKSGTSWSRDSEEQLKDGYDALILLPFAICHLPFAFLLLSVSMLLW